MSKERYALQHNYQAYIINILQTWAQILLRNEKVQNNLFMKTQVYRLNEKNLG